MKPTGFSSLPGASGSSPLPYSHPRMGFSAGKCDQAQGEGRAEQEASELGLGSGLTSAPALSTTGASPAERNSPARACICGQQGLPAGTSARPVDASTAGGLSCTARQAAQAGHRKPNSDVLDPLGGCMGRDCTTACKPSRGPCAPLAVAQALLYVSREGLCKMSTLCYGHSAS